MQSYIWPLHRILNILGPDEISAFPPHQVYGLLKTADPARFRKSRSYLFCHLFKLSSKLWLVLPLKKTYINLLKQVDTPYYSLSLPSNNVHSCWQVPLLQRLHDYDSFYQLAIGFVYLPCHRNTEQQLLHHE